MSFWREPKVDAEWRQRRELHDVARQRAAADPEVRATLQEARAAFDELLAAPSDRAAEAFWECIARAASMAVKVTPALAEIAVPTGAALPILAREMAAAVFEDRIAIDGHPLARELRDELSQDRSLRRTPFLRPLDEIRRELGVKRERGAPVGPQRSRAGWTDVPETLPALFALIQPTVTSMREKGQVVKVKNVAARLGIDERRLRDAFAHHGIRGAAMLKTLRRADSEKSR